MQIEPLKITSASVPPVKPKRPPHRYWAVQDKRRIVEETFPPGASVAAVARKYDLNSNMLFRWRRLYRRGEFGPAGPQPRESIAEFVSVGVIGEDGRLVPDMPGIAKGKPVIDQGVQPERQTPQPAVESQPAASQRVDLQLACGARISFESSIDDASLRRLITLIKETA